MSKIATWSPLDPAGREAFDGPFVVLHLPRERSRKTWTGMCVELGTMAIGKTEAEARKSLIELVTLQLNTLEATGQRERVFRERDIPIYNEVPNNLPPPVVDGLGEAQLFEALPAA